MTFRSRRMDHTHVRKPKRVMATSSVCNQSRLESAVNMEITIISANPPSVMVAPRLSSDCERAISALNLSRVVIYHLMQNVRGLDRPTGYTRKVCSEREAMPSDNLWAVARTPLFARDFLHFCAISGVVGAENRKNGQKIRFSGS